MKYEVSKLGFHKTFEYHFRLTVTHLHLVLIGIVVFHILFLQFNIDFLKTWKTVVINGQEYVQLESGETLLVKNETQALDPNKITMRLGPRSHNRPAKLESILEQELKKLNIKQKINVKESTNQARKNLTSSNVQKKQTQFGLFNVPNMLEEKIELQKTKSSSLDLKKIRMIVYKKSGKYQKCYEKSLLLDDFMEGLVNIEILISSQKVSKSVVNFKGSGSSQAIKKFKQCLSLELGNLRFMQGLENQIVRFNLFFKS